MLWLVKMLQVFSGAERPHSTWIIVPVTSSQCIKTLLNRSFFMNSIFCDIMLCTTVKVNQRFFVVYFMLSYLASSVTLKLGVTHSSEMSIDFHQTMQHYIPGASHDCENHISNISFFTFTWWIFPICSLINAVSEAKSRVPRNLTASASPVLKNFSLKVKTKIFFRHWQ